MPQAIAYVVYTVGSAIGNMALAVAIADALIKLAILTAINMAFQPDLSMKRSLRHDITTRGPVDPCKIVYGQALVSGPIAYNNAAGVNNRDLWYVVMMAAHEVDNIVDVHLDARVIPEADVNYGTDGSVKSGTPFFNRGNPYLFLFRQLGTSTQTVVPQLDSAFSDITTAHRGRGMAYLVAQLRLNDDSSKIWDGGPPQNIRALVRGKKIYDPRRDPTTSVYGGTGSQALGTPSTWEWSDNPVWCLTDYMTDASVGMGIPSAQFDYELLAVEADYCDALVSIPSGTEKRYTCNGVLLTTVEHRENISNILGAMNGRITYAQGKFKIEAGRFIAPTVTIDTTFLAGDVTVKTGTPKASRFNTLRAYFVDPVREYKTVQTIDMTGSTFLTRDNNEELLKELRLQMTNTNTMAQRIGIIQLQGSDEQKIAMLPCNYKALQLAMHEQVNVTISELGWSNKVFRVIGWELNDIASSEGGINLVLKEDSSGAYVDPVVGDYSTLAASGTIIFPDKDVPEPTLDSVVGVIGGVVVRFTAPDQDDAWSQIRIYASATNLFSSASVVGETKGTFFNHELSLEETRFYWITAIRGGEESGTDPVTSTTTFTATALKGTAGASAGTDLFDEDEVLFFNKDISNDRLVSSIISTENYNAYMGIQLGADERPAGWYRSIVAVDPVYVDPEIRDRAIFAANSLVSNAALRCNPLQVYSCFALVAADSGTTDVSIKVQEFDTDLLPAGKSVIGSGTNPEAEVQTRTRVLNLNTVVGVTTTFQLILATYTPTSTCKWFSLSIVGTSDTRVDYAVVANQADRTSDNNNWSEVGDDDGFRPNFIQGSDTDRTSIGIGFEALNSVVSGAKRNTAVGHQALKNISANDGNTAVGYLALRDCTGFDSVAVGASAGIIISSGTSGTFIGQAAGAAWTVGDFNVAVGAGAGGALLVATGSRNTYIGTGAGQGFSGSRNIIIGFDARLTTFTTDDDILIIHNGENVNPIIHGDMYTRDLEFNADVIISNNASGSSGNLDVEGTLTANAAAASLITSGTFADARIPNLNASKITAGTLVVARGGTGVTSKTGTGSVVLSVSPALTGTPTITEKLQHAGDADTHLTFGTNFIQLIAGGTTYFQANFFGLAATGVGLSVAGPTTPGTDDTFDLGSASFRWDDVWATNTTIQSSDWHKKTAILPTRLGSDFIYGLKPKEFVWKDGGVRTHHGFISQDVKALLDEQGVDTKDFAGYIHGHTELQDGMDPEDFISEEYFGLRLQEFIAPLVATIQEQNERIKALESRR